MLQDTAEICNFEILLVLIEREIAKSSTLRNFCSCFLIPLFSLDVVKTVANELVKTSANGKVVCVEKKGQSDYF